MLILLSEGATLTMSSEHVFEFDVFISYSSKDKDWVRGELLTKIEQAGVKACIDFRDFTRGAPGIKEMERAVEQSRKTLLILTPNYIESGWAEIENIMAGVLDPANRDLRLLPLLKADCKRSPRITALTHIDFTEAADHDLAWRQLLTALGRAPEPEPPKEPRRDEWFLAHPYPMPPNFTGRIAERSTLTVWLNGDPAHPLLVLRALGGFGKSALTWHWLMNDVAPASWPRVVWWSFYEGDASFDHFLDETLKYLSGGKFDGTKISGRDAVRALLQSLVAPGTLLVLDGFERVLRAFGGLDAAYQGDEEKREGNERDCISPLAETFLYNVAALPQFQSKVLLTTRLTPRIVEAKGGGLLRGAVERPLLQMQPPDAVEFFHAQGIRGTRAEIESACAPYGYHPLSLRLLAGLIVRDFRQPGDIAAAQRLDVSGDLVQRQHHVLEMAYDSLTHGRRALLGRIACFRSPVLYDALKALAEDQDERSLNDDLHDLFARGLLQHDRKENRFDLHPIVRRYAYDWLTLPDRAAAHTRLRDYFIAVPEPANITGLKDLNVVIELYHHTVRAGQLDEAVELFHDRLHKALYYQLGAYQLIIDLLQAVFPDGEGHPPRLKDERAQGWTLCVLSSAYAVSGQPSRAVQLIEASNQIEEGRDDKKDISINLVNVAEHQFVVGALRTAEVNLRRAIALSQQMNEARIEAVAHRELGRLLTYRGEDDQSAAELTTGLGVLESRMAVQSQCILWTYRVIRDLLRLRRDLQGVDHKSTLVSACHVLELTNETARTRFPHERDYLIAYWLLGAAHRVAGQMDKAEPHLNEALERCRRINAIDTEADILIDLARLRAATGAPDEAELLAEEALVITERCGYVLQGADAHLELAKLALARGDKVVAKEHAQKARDLATCDGPPDYTYKAAYDEAGALLKQLE